MNTPSIDRVPEHLKKFTALQHYDSYTPEEQATWRYILRQLRDFLKDHAHSCYSEGLKKTGIGIESIPKIKDMDLLLQDFGWGAVPVSGFIPPAAFMEFQSLSILPVACDMRTLDHLLYTPAPDIVHEAAGHAPILIHPEYAEYLKNYAQVAKKSIISREDLDQYEAIRKLSDIKESGDSTAQDILKAEKKLVDVNHQISHVSEASLLSRMNWWTAEYGLIGDLKNPKIYGAGLLSSLGESRDCLKSHVQKIPLDISCVDVSYDITEPQPQLFVTPDFKTLNEVLEDLAKRLSFRRGGRYGLDVAIKSKATNTVQLNSGLQISGQLESYKSEGENIQFLKFTGPSQLSLNEAQLSGHGPKFHSHGYSSPIGPLKNVNKSLDQCSELELARMGIKIHSKIRLEYASGIVVEGDLKSWIKNEDQLVAISLINATAQWNGEVLFEPSWGQYDIACGDRVTSVYGGPADRLHFGEVEDFAAERVPQKNYSDQTKLKFNLYQRVRDARSQSHLTEQDLNQLWKDILISTNHSWLMCVEILELAQKNNFTLLTEAIMKELNSKNYKDKDLIHDGIRLAKE